VLEGCEAISHSAGSDVGVLVIHGFTGSPFSVRGVADAMTSAGFDVEAPRLPGHGTTVEDMLDTRWDDWGAEVAAAHDRLAARCRRVVVAGQSLGATLALWTALRRGDVAGVVCINPLVVPRAADELALIDELLADGLAIVPGGGSDIADPDGFDISYDGTPLAPIRSALVDGVATLAPRLGELDVALRLFTSRQDHVVDPSNSDHLAAVWAGPVEHTWLERSYHVATRDLDRDILEQGAADFVREVAA